MEKGSGGCPGLGHDIYGGGLRRSYKKGPRERRALKIQESGMFPLS